jgi:hypothetical protein
MLVKNVSVKLEMLRLDLITNINKIKIILYKGVK